jgi:hypothetical protein
MQSCHSVLQVQSIPGIDDPSLGSPRSPFEVSKAILECLPEIIFKLTDIGIKLIILPFASDSTSPSKIDIVRPVAIRVRFPVFIPEEDVPKAPDMSKGGAVARIERIFSKGGIGCCPELMKKNPWELPAVEITIKDKVQLLPVISMGRPDQNVPVALGIELVDLSGIWVMDHGQGIEVFPFKPGQVPVPDVVIFGVRVQVDAVIKEVAAGFQESHIGLQVHRCCSGHLGIGPAVQHQVPNFMPVNAEEMGKMRSPVYVR